VLRAGPGPADRCAWATLGCLAAVLSLSQLLLNLPGPIMPVGKPPTAEDAMAVRRVLLDGFARDAGIGGLSGELAPLHRVTTLPSRRPRARRPPPRTRSHQPRRLTCALI
jgi:hypothetical protein